MCHVPIPRRVLGVLERGKTDIMPDKTDFPEIRHCRGWSPGYSRGFDVAKIPALMITTRVIISHIKEYSTIYSESN